MKNCAICCSENDDPAAHCAWCGTTFDGKPSVSRISQTDPVLAAADKRMLSGALWCIGGIVVTTVTFVSAVNNPSGGIYVIAWGAIIFGGQRFFWGYFEGWSVRKTRPDRDGNQIAKSAEETEIRSNSA